MAKKKIPGRTFARPRLLKLVQAFDKIAQSGYGEVEGVRIDLRHDDLPVDKWFAPGLSDWRDWNSPPLDGPLVTFPWQPRSSEPGWLAVEPGETVRVARVETVIRGEPFEPLADREQRRAFLSIVRKSGGAITIDEPLEFLRHGSFLGAGPGVSFRNIACRICEANGFASIFDFCLGPELADSETYEEEMLILAQQVADKRLALASALADKSIAEDAVMLTQDGLWPVFESADHYKVFEVQRAFDAAIALGYWWARYEAERDMRPLAESGLASRKGGAVGGKKSGEARRRKAAESWEAHALDLAWAIRQSNPEWSQDKVAGEIEDRWELDGNPPSTRFSWSVSRDSRSG